MTKMTKMTFETWLAKVDVILVDKFGVDSGDLPDKSYWDKWDEGWTPLQAVKHFFRGRMI